MVRFIALLASHPEAAGYEVDHASVDNDMLVVLTTLGVADEDGLIMLTVLSGPEKHIFTTNAGTQQHVFSQ